jgi:4-hydroxybenzoate polyprenyltransferase
MTWDRWRPYAQLVRLPNVFTAAADSLAGWLVAVGTLADPTRWLPLCLASMALYAAGIALNDVFDVEVDRAERPGRPIPSGRVPLRTASRLGWGLLALGLACAGLSGSLRSLAVAVALAVAIVGYNAGLKRTPLGPLAMGSCRGLNLALGLSGAADFAGLPGGIAIAAITVFVAGITCISRAEVRTGERILPLIGLVLLVAGQGGMIAFGIVRSERLPQGANRTGLILGLALHVALGAIVQRAAAIGALRAVPEMLQRAVKTSVLSLVWLDVLLVLMTRGVAPALVVATLWVPAFLLGKRLYST